MFYWDTTCSSSSRMPICQTLTRARQTDGPTSDLMQLLVKLEQQEDKVDKSYVDIISRPLHLHRSFRTQHYH